MLIKMDRAALDRCLDTIEKALPSHSTIPVIENILFESNGNSLIFTSSNFDMVLKYKIPFSAGESGKMLLPPKIVDIVRYLPAPELEIDLNMENYRCDISSGEAKYNLYGADASEYPLVQELIPEAGILTMLQSSLKQVLKSVVFAASNDESRPAFNGVLFDFQRQEIKLISSDTYRLVVKELKNESWNLDEKKYLVPAKSLRELVKILGDNGDEVKIYPVQKNVVFSLGQVYLATRLLDENYPDVSGVIPASFSTRVKVERKQMENSIGRAALLTEGINQPVRLAVSNNKIEVKVSSQLGRMEESVNAAQDGEDIDIYINSRFVLEILKVLDQKEIIIDFHGKNGPVIFRIKEDKDYLYLVLPIKMD